jgi:hypothetical protein
MMNCNDQNDPIEAVYMWISKMNQALRYIDFPMRRVVMGVNLQMALNGYP